jgi:hypothetical protein
MKRVCMSVVLMVGFIGLLAFPSAAQMGTGEAANILRTMPPDLFAKVQTLANLLQQGMKEGKLTEAEVQQGMLSGHLSEKIKSYNPQAGQLLDEISDAMKNGQGPGAENLMPLMDGLGMAGN